MNKKVLFILPALLLVSACGGKKGEDILDGAKEKDFVFTADAEEQKKFGAAVDKVVSTYDNATGVILGVEANGSLSLSEEVTGKSQYPNGRVVNETEKASLEIKNAKASAEIGVGGFKRGDAASNTKDLVGYAKASASADKVAISYELPPIAKEGGAIPNFIPLSGALEFKDIDASVSAYVKGGNVYADLSDKGFIKLANSILNNDVIDIAALIGMEKPLDFENILSTFGLSTKLGIGNLIPPASFKVPELPSVGATVEQYLALINSEQYKSIKAMIQPIAEALNFKSYVYKDGSDFAYAVSLGVDGLDGVQKAYDAIRTVSGAPAIDIKSYAKSYGVDVSKFSFDLSIAIAKNGGLAIQGNLAAKASFDAKNITAVKLPSSLVSAKASLDLDAGLIVKANFSTTSAISQSLPSDLSKYTMINF